MQTLRDIIVAEIRRSGPMPFWRYMDMALYWPDLGYYTRGSSPVGRAGDFITSPSASPLFGRVLAGLVDCVVAATAGSGRVRVVDAGADDGRLLDALIERALARNRDLDLEAVVVERGTSRRAAAMARIARHDVVLSSCADTAELSLLPPRRGVVIANELFDALPLRRVRNGETGVEEAYVDYRSDRLVEVWISGAEVEPVLPIGREYAIAVGVAPLVAQLASGIERGLLLVIDYGYPASILYAPDGAGNPLRGFRNGTLADDLFATPGSIDLTAHVDFTTIDRAARELGLERVFFCDQTYLLLTLGLLAEPAAPSARRLIHPEDMGGSFKVLLASKGLDRSREPAKSALARLDVRDRGALLDRATTTPDD